MQYLLQQVSVHPILSVRVVALNLEEYSAVGLFTTLPFQYCTLFALEVSTCVDTNWCGPLFKHHYCNSSLSVIDQSNY